jgi:aminopeptidase
MDEGAKMLGEVALVEVTSPINLTNILFYNTLYDENASCHLALGRAYTDNIKDFDKKSEEELKACGKNDSMIHVDFMIGSDSLEIIGYTHDGTAVKVFENGVFVI